MVTEYFVRTDRCPSSFESINLVSWVFTCLHLFCVTDVNRSQTGFNLIIFSDSLPNNRLIHPRDRLPLHSTARGSLTGPGTHCHTTWPMPTVMYGDDMTPSPPSPPPLQWHKGLGRLTKKAFNPSTVPTISNISILSRTLSYAGTHTCKFTHRCKSTALWAW